MGFYYFFSNFQGALSKKKEFEKMSQEGKAGQPEVQEIATRTDTLSYALLVIPYSIK